MGKRIRLGLIFSVDENWIGGSYYILNLISALGMLPDNEQPVINILSTRKSDFLAAQKTGYKYLDYKNPFYKKRNLAEAMLNKFFRWFLKSDVIDKRLKDIDIVFPATSHISLSAVKNRVYWFPDFQHIHFPDLFSKDELARRANILNEIAESNRPLVLSSYSAKKDWESLKLSTNCKIHVLPFAVTHPLFDELNITELCREFNIEKEYFIISNQFWKHKNHMLVLKAIVLLKAQKHDFEFVFTGKKEGYEADDYFEGFIDFINKNELSNSVKILGLIDREKQLKLMKHAKAVIQPSLFEGWSTVIEDAKSMNRPIIASDIPVHREQLASGSYFFDPYSVPDLVKAINTFLQNPVEQLPIRYDENVLKFGKTFMSLVRT